MTYSVLWHVRPIETLFKKDGDLKIDYPNANILVLSQVLEYLKPTDYLVRLNGWKPNFMTDKILELEEFESSKIYKTYKTLLMLKEKGFLHAVITKNKTRYKVIGFVA